MKECVDEFKDLDVKYIEENCFVGKVHVNEVSVDQDTLDADSTVVGSFNKLKQTEEKEMKEKQYVTPELEITEFETEDVIVTSDWDGDGDKTPVIHGPIG